MNLLKPLVAASALHASGAVSLASAQELPSKPRHVAAAPQGTIPAAPATVPTAPQFPYFSSLPQDVKEAIVRGGPAWAICEGLAPSLLPSHVRDPEVEACTSQTGDRN